MWAVVSSIYRPLMIQRIRYSWLSKKPIPVLRTLLMKISYHLAIMAIGTTLSGVTGPPPMKPEM